ncbi:hypothetical protein C8Q76DRAFT_628954, partial [Earliella scabrosa]
MRRARDQTVRAAEDVVIPPGESRLVNVTAAAFPVGVREVLVERTFNVTRNEDDVYGAPDTLLSRDSLKLHVANFSQFPARIGRGQALGTIRDPKSWLDKTGKYSGEQLQQMRAHAAMISQLVHEQLKNMPPSEALADYSKAIAPELRTARGGKAGEEDPLASEPVEGGPKVSETPADEVPSSALINAVDISSELSSEDRQKLLEVLERNRAAFSLDGKLGRVQGSTCNIPLRDGAKEVSLPPFPTSPAKREVV